MRTLSAMWNAFDRLGKLGMIGGLIGLAAGMLVPVIVILVVPGGAGGKIVFLAPMLLFDVVFFVIFAFAFGGVFGSLARRKDLQETGVRAEATITGLKDTGLTVNEIYPVARIQLEVRPPGGHPYQAEVKTPVNRLDIPQIQPGSVVEVVYDPSDPSEVALAVADPLAAGAASSTTGAPGGIAPFTGGGGAAQKEQARAMEEFLRKNDAESEAIRATGQPAPAVIVQAMPLNVFVNGSNPAMTFVLEVQPEGQPAFQAQVTGVIAERSVPKYQPGKAVHVKFDPHDHTRVSLE